MIWLRLLHMFDSGVPPLRCVLDVSFSLMLRICDPHGSVSVHLCRGKKLLLISVFHYHVRIVTLRNN